MNYKITSRCEEDTMEIAENIESEKFPGMVICLDGELGSGKTVFVKGFAKALGIVETVTSPTFSLVKEYNLFNEVLCFQSLKNILMVKCLYIIWMFIV